MEKTKLQEIKEIQTKLTELTTIARTVADISETLTLALAHLCTRIQCFAIVQEHQPEKA